MNKVLNWMPTVGVICLLSFSSLHAQDSALEDCAEEALDGGDYKEAIVHYQKLFDEAEPQKKPRYLMKQAGVYFRDQQHEKAFSTFLQSLEMLETPAECAEMSGDERDLYKEGLALYLSQDKEGARKVSMELRQKYSPIVALHQDYYNLNYLIAASYANLGMYPEFFSRFFHSYAQCPTTFMAYRTIAVLHIKIFERTRDPIEREKQRDLVLSNMSKALDLNPSDTSLYKLMIGFSRDEERGKMVTESLNRILVQNIVIPRREIFFYVQSAITTGQYDLAEKFLNKASSWYEYSRSVAAAKQLLEQTKNTEITTKGN